VIITIALHVFDYHLFEVFVTNAVGLESREEVTNKPEEEWNIIEYELWHVHITQGAHKHDILTNVCVSSLKLTSHYKHRLQGTKTEVVVVLLRQLLSRQFVEHCHLLSESLS